MIQWKKAREQVEPENHAGSFDDKVQARGAPNPSGVTYSVCTLLRQESMRWTRGHDVAKFKGVDLGSKRIPEADSHHDPDVLSTTVYGRVSL